MATKNKTTKASKKVAVKRDRTGGGKAKLAEKTKPAEKAVAAEDRVVIRVSPATDKLIRDFAKVKGDLAVGTAADKLIAVAAGRLGALKKYNSTKAPATPAPKRARKAESAPTVEA